MRLAVTVKSIGKRKNAFSRIPVELLPSPRTLRELIAGLVEWNIRGLLEKQQQDRFAAGATEGESYPRYSRRSDRQHRAWSRRLGYRGELFCDKAAAIRRHGLLGAAFGRA